MQKSNTALKTHCLTRTQDVSSASKESVRLEELGGSWENPAWGVLGTGQQNPCACSGLLLQAQTLKNGFLLPFECLE